MSAAEKASPETEGVSLGGYIDVLRRRRWWVVGCVVVAVAFAAFYSFYYATPTYQATARVLRQTTSFDQALFDTQLFKLRDADRDLRTGSDLVKLDAVAQMVKEDLDSPRTTRALLRRITVTPQSETDIINITGVSTDPEEAAAVANSFAHQFILYRQASDRAALSQARIQVEQLLSEMKPAERSSERGIVLAQKSEELRVLESMQTGGFEVIQDAAVPTGPSSPRSMINLFLAVVGGLLVGVLLAFVVDRVDRRIKSGDALEKEFGLPVLATIPRGNLQQAANGNRPVGGPTRFLDPSPAFAEAFRALRSNVKYFEFDRQIRTIVITSGLPQEGKTVTSINLAISLALSGATVGLIEADLRRPMLHRYLNLSAGVGVSSVLAGTHTLPKAMQLVKIGNNPSWDRGTVADPARANQLERNLFCLTSGPLPPNPAELIGSQQMKTLIEDSISLADYVLIDTPPVLVVADALSLVNYVDAVIVCSRLNRTTIEEAREVRTLLQRTGAHTLGLVASGTRSSSKPRYDSYGYLVGDR